MSRLLRLAVSAGLLAFLAARLDWGQMGAALRGLRVDWALGALALFITMPLVASYRWQLLAKPLGFDARSGELGYALHHVCLVHNEMPSISAPASRVIKSCIESRGDFFSNKTAYISLTIGISIPLACASR